MRLAARLVRRLALALSHAHAQGAFHRGLNAKNIMVCRHRDLVVVDFGLAQLARAEDAPIVQREETVGTLAYMAPEEVRGDSGAVGAGCDIYSLEAILYELLTGRRPFDGPHTQVPGMIAAADAERPSRHRGDLDPLLDEICVKAMAKKAEDR